MAFITIIKVIWWSCIWPWRSFSWSLEVTYNSSKRNFHFWLRRLFIWNSSLVGCLLFDEIPTWNLRQRHLTSRGHFDPQFKPYPNVKFPGLSEFGVKKTKVDLQITLKWPLLSHPRSPSGGPDNLSNFYTSNFLDISLSWWGIHTLWTPGMCLISP